MFVKILSSVLNGPELLPVNFVMTDAGLTMDWDLLIVVSAVRYREMKFTIALLPAIIVTTS